MSATLLLHGFQEIKTSVKENRSVWLLLFFGFPAMYYVAMLLALIIRFENIPNYATAYDYFSNVAEIIRSTPSVRDMIPIIMEEWLFEIGYMNSDYGAPISEWSLNIMPAKVATMFVLSGLLATNFCLLRRNSAGQACSTAGRRSAHLATGVGASLVGVTTLTMSWVVCCATPTWVVGLAMLGVGVSTSLWLEFLGPWMSSAGFILLTATLVLLSITRAARAGNLPVSGFAASGRPPAQYPPAKHSTVEVS